MCSNEILAKSVKGPDGALDITLLKRAELLIWKFVQDKCFHSEIKRLKAGKSVERSSRLSKLSMEIGEDNLLRLNGRLPFKSNLTEESRKPVVLDGKHEIVKMMIREVHHYFGHANHQMVMNEVNQKFYVLNLRNVVRSVSHHCQWCRTYRSKPQNVPQGNLPLERIAHHEPPFTCSAVDYFGPMSVTIGRRHEKCWGVLFTCLTTRAVHLELAASLTPASMIMALRRFIARRGKPAVIYSDNGTNFKAAHKELLQACEECYEGMKNESFRKYMKWKFIPRGTPHMGGAWERLVRSIKIALTATLKERSPREEVLHTLLLEAEHTVNSRPLVTFSMDSPEEGLTPNNFLLGRSCGDRPPGLFLEQHLTGQLNWKSAQRLADHFWTR
ncbi:unnamed protein product [Parnassius apollo]|uniref:(apollo) hypothetical protein n=1 Tax=Parnassius apollo TaxID=110799 RepID=A0A8S3YBB2_PARAO|nr:unnamed protein product [Parnassius apollo]